MTAKATRPIDIITVAAKGAVLGVVLLVAVVVLAAVVVLVVVLAEVLAVGVDVAVGTVDLDAVLVDVTVALDADGVMVNWALTLLAATAMTATRRAMRPAYVIFSSNATDTCIQLTTSRAIPNFGELKF